MDRDQKMRVEQALNVARECMATRFKEANFAFVAGSIISGEGTDFSDIDLVVVFPSLERARRESFVMESVPVEALCMLRRRSRISPKEMSKAVAR